MNEQQTFRFQYTAITISATIAGGVLKIKQGLRTFEVPLDRLVGFYVESHHGKMLELIVSYQAGTDKKKIVRTYSDTGQPEFDRLVEALVAMKPEGDFRALPSKQAYEKLGAVNMLRAALIAVPLIVLAVMAVGMFPFLVHGVDDGMAPVSAAELAAGKVLPSRNLRLTGVLDTERGIVETITRKGTTTTHNFFPVRVPGAPPNAPVAVVLETREVGDAELSQLTSAGSFRCVLRNVFWEGLSSDNAAFFEDQLDVSLADDVYLCELGINTGFSLLIYLLAVGVTLVVMIVVAIVLARQNRKKQ